MAKTLALAATRGGLQAMLTSDVGGEMRGGPSQASVVVDDEGLRALPILPSTKSVVVMHPKHSAFALGRLVPGGLALVNSSVADPAALRDAAADRRRRGARRGHARAGAALPGTARGGEPARPRGRGRNGAGGMTAATARQLLDGCAAITESAIAAGCRFFAGYPISPFTGLLENMSRRLPEAGGHCLNAESEIEAVNMALGASASGARAATGSCGQGLALMQEAIAELALNELPLVIFNMARNQQDYCQATRGGGWGDYRTLTLAPKDVPEAVEHTQLLFHLADRYRAPVMLYGDPLIAQTHVSVDVAARDFGPLPAKDWALDGTTGGTGRSRQIWTWAMGKATEPGPGPDGHLRGGGAQVGENAAGH